MSADASAVTDPESASDFRAEPATFEPGTSAPEEAAAGPARGGGMARARLALLVLCGVLTAVLVVLLVFVALALGKASDADTKQAASRDATNAATKDVPIFGSYSYATIAADQKRAEALFVPSLRANYDKLLNPILQTLQQRKVVVSVVVQQAQATQVTSATSVQVLAFFTQTTSSPTSTAPSVKPYALAIQMQKINGTWLVAAVNPPS